ncbi:MAG: tRNA (guanosine(46)-N7)-methyltransferase TrmB [Planctomycetes bacterium]|nr:tRNA (guanosine(46)-N7)-methyltransferase TrmB [Planctomycetota bacterium]
MPRRPPKKLDPALDLSAHLIALADLPEPLDPAALFSRAAPVELEVGSGKGLFLDTASATRADRNFLGIELAAGYARLCAARLARRAATNARIIHGDATRLVRSLLPDACLAAVHVYFPDPWWKARHRKRRVLSATFLEHAGRVLPADGELHVWTDVEEYFLESLDFARATGLFAEPVSIKTRPAEHDLDYHTHFERRTRLAGAPVWRALLARNDRPATLTRLP